MRQVSDAFLAELGLQRSGPRADPWGDDPGLAIWRAGSPIPCCTACWAGLNNVMHGVRQPVTQITKFTKDAGHD